MPGEKAETGSADISVTVKKDSTFSNEVIQMYQLSIQNNTSQWLELEGAKLTAGKNVEVLVGDFVDSWIEACMIEKKVTDYNISLVLGAVAVSGAVVAGASSHQETSSVAAIVALGSISGLAVRDYQKAKSKIDFQKAFPEKHLFRNSVIPPKKVVQRWILVENRKAENFTLTFNEGIAVNIVGKNRY